MSSKPHPEGVRQLRCHADQYRSLCHEALRLKSVIASETKHLQEVEADRRSAHTELLKSLEAMDCSRSGNTGWEERIAWLLGEFEHQARTSTPGPLPAA